MSLLLALILVLLGNHKYHHVTCLILWNASGGWGWITLVTNVESLPYQWLTTALVEVAGDNEGLVQQSSESFFCLESQSLVHTSIWLLWSFINSDLALSLDPTGSRENHSTHSGLHALLCQNLVWLKEQHYVNYLKIRPHSSAEREVAIPSSVEARTSSITPDLRLYFNTHKQKCSSWRCEKLNRLRLF